MINKIWKIYIDVDFSGDEYDADYEKWFVEDYLDLGEVYPIQTFYNNCWGALEYCAQEHKITAPGNGFVYMLLFLQKIGLIRLPTEFDGSIYTSVLTDEGKEVLAWMQERERKEKENEENNMAGTVVQ